MIKKGSTHILEDAAMIPSRRVTTTKKKDHHPYYYYYKNAFLATK